MWQKQLKQIKKQSPESKSEIKNTQPIAKAQPDISFNQYCQQTHVEQLKYTPIVNLKPAPTKHFSLDIQNESNNFDFMMFDEQDSQKEFFKFGQRNLPKELRSGKFQFNAVLDLHNYTKAHAIDILDRFIANSVSGACLRIIHGVGLNSEFNQPVLLGAVRKYLAQHPQVLAYSYGSPKQGGLGVTIVKLTSS